ncbi:hypothetical protein WME90_23665 [Sorangium sp. So ce375]|uniref:hypothetical protein n=1 Tax=Sorangium sp. So ce375 TaxID=3133306 RepID=UPI003F5B6932
MTDSEKENYDRSGSFVYPQAAMDRRAQITATPLHVPSILVVLDPAWPALFSLCLTVAPGCGVLLHRCDAATAATIAAERRPLAILLSNGVYARDPADFEALARDVRATLLRLDDEVSERELEVMLNGALREARVMNAQRETGRRDEGSGRYTMIGAHRSETVGAKGAASADPRTPQQPGVSGDPRLAPRVRETSSSQSSMPPPSARSGAPPSARAPLASHALTPVPPSSAPPSFRSPPSVPSAPPLARTQPSAYAPGEPRSAPPPSARSLSIPAPAHAEAATSGRLSSLPPSSGRAELLSSPPPSSGRAELLSSPPPSVRAQPSAPPPLPSRALPGGTAARRPTPMPPSSGQAGPPSSARSLPSPPSLRAMANAPPSVRSVPPGALSNTEPPPSIRAMGPLSARMAPASSVRPELSPRSGVRERGSEELDAVFEDQKLPLDALARGNRGTTTTR